MFAALVQEKKPPADQPPVPDQPIPAEISRLLDENKDVFPEELPAGLPSKRQVEHEIELEPGGLLHQGPSTNYLIWSWKS